ncbi:M23 family metallopeptidase [Spirochaeta cellobiosiphila]|uniref:M23 family metallopeptidase n=1 Tax=Spirochaeta cellobiosiphila TaxID=504483 RepID=UPI000422DADF|nr:M23 family metallopeptidase [Spirochaeta cellobiosiphila]
MDFKLINSIILFCLSIQIGGQSFYPQIKQTIGKKDLLFVQLEKEVKQYYLYEAAQQKAPPLKIYEYVLERNMDIFDISSYFGLPYEAVVTLNQYENNRALIKGNTVLIPNQPGLFTSIKGRNSLEQMIILRLSPKKEPQKLKLPINNHLETILFWSGDRFHPIERSYYLKILFQPPLSTYHLTSHYGYRANPFTGHQQFHNGVDLAAPIGTEVYAAAGGVVYDLGNNNILGKYIIIDHQNGYKTVYGHLKKINVFLNQDITSGMIIGVVGMTGMTTGPHLHFEIRKDDKSQDPMKLMREDN